MATGRREQNKEEKRERILAAATKLFAVKGVDEVTTQEIADAADIGAGTLFLYAKNKGELLLMAQNAHYANALAEGVAAANNKVNPVDAVMAIVTPIVACNRTHIGNGRTYLKEMAFGDPTEPHHARALEIVNDTEIQLAHALIRTAKCDARTAAAIARIVSALLLRNMAPIAEFSGGINEILSNIRHDIESILSLRN